MRDFLSMIYEREMPWTLCKVRKPATCVITGKSIDVGDLAYRPVTNGPDRMKRIKPASRHKLPPVPREESTDA